MANIILRPDWHIPERMVTPEETYINRRGFLKSVGLGTLAFGLLGCTSSSSGDGGTHLRDSLRAIDDLPSPNGDLYPAPRNNAYVVDREMTDEALATSYNNFYEFSEQKEVVKSLVGDFRIRPWELEITGLVSRPRKFTIDELVRLLPLEERVYRFRCVEAWAMTVPWTGIPLAKVLALAEPLSSARFVRFISFDRPEQAPNQRRATWYTWPYYEGMRIDEATNELAMLVTGMYGHELPKQNGAPARIIVPWKYGYKNPKSIVRIELVADRPATFWNDLAPDEYSFQSNVDPTVPHPRWSQATERLLGPDTRVPTLPYNGYGAQVGRLYG